MKKVLVNNKAQLLVAIHNAQDSFENTRVQCTCGLTIHMGGLDKMSCTTAKEANNYCRYLGRRNDMFAKIKGNIRRQPASLFRI